MRLSLMKGPSYFADSPSYFVVIAGTIALFCLIIALADMGRRMAARRLGAEKELSFDGSATIEAAIFGLMGLLLAFSFSGAAERFEHRRQLIGQEANAIGTAYLRIDLLPESAQPKLREAMRNYVDARLALYADLPTKPNTANADWKRAQSIQRDIWNQAIAATRQLGPAASASGVTLLVIDALNAMIDITTDRNIAYRAHPPAAIFVMLFILIAACSFLAGYRMASSRTPSRFHMASFAGILTVTILIVVEYEFPRFGLIRIDPVDQMLVSVRKGM